VTQLPLPSLDLRAGIELRQGFRLQLAVKELLSSLSKGGDHGAEVGGTTRLPKFWFSVTWEHWCRRWARVVRSLDARRHVVFTTKDGKRDGTAMQVGIRDGRVNVV
jgi:hypothetical protein